MYKPNQIKAVTGGILIDGTGAGPVEGATVLIEGDAITATGRGIDVPEGPEVIDATGVTGEQADVIVVDGDPLRDVRLLENVEAIKLVMKGGVVEVDRRS